MKRLDTTEAKPCPFCGGYQIFMIKEKDYDANINDAKEQAVKGTVWFNCVFLSCKSKSEQASSISGALKKWNRRV